MQVANKSKNVSLYTAHVLHILNACIASCVLFFPLAQGSPNSVLDIGPPGPSLDTLALVEVKAGEDGQLQK